MRIEPITIELGEKSFEIRPLTVGQIEDIESVLASLGPGATAKILEIVLRRAYPEDAANAGEIETTRRQKEAAISAILRLGDFVEIAPGEEKALEVGA